MYIDITVKSIVFIILYTKWSLVHYPFYTGNNTYNELRSKGNWEVATKLATKNEISKIVYLTCIVISIWIQQKVFLIEIPKLHKQSPESGGYLKGGQAKM